MSTSLLYHAFGARGYQYRRTDYEARRVIISLVESEQRHACPGCGRRDMVLKGTIERCLKSVPIGRKQVVFRVPVQRVWCWKCQAVRQCKLSIADPYRSYTRAFERYARDLLRFATIHDVADHLDVGWDLIKDIEKRYLTAKYGQPRLKDVRLLAIDEISIGKGHRYLTVVLNWQTGRVLFVGDGKGSDALKPFWELLGRRKGRIEAVAIDMSPAYIKAVGDNLPKAKIVFDHFHVVKLFNEKLSDLRREVQAEAETKLQKKVLKGSRWLLLKNPENLDDSRNERQRLDEALRLNKPLATGYYLKEDLRQIWSQPDKRTAGLVLEDWARRARVSGIRILMKFADTLMAHRSGILAYYDHPISTGPLEGLNNKIKTMTRKAYGFRDTDFLKLKILGIHATRYELVG